MTLQSIVKTLAALGALYGVSVAALPAASCVSFLLRWFLLSSMVLVLMGMIIGIPAALASARLITSWLYGVGGADPLTIVVSALLMTAVALLASFLPARRASKIDPMIALRYE